MGQMPVDPPSGARRRFLLGSGAAAASAVRARYDPSPADLPFEEAKKRAHKPEKLTRGPADTTWGDPEKALANAVYRATGKRVRDLPITLDKLL